MNQPSTLTVSALLNNEQYIIPIYQRNYAWGETEIEALLTDIYKAMIKNPDKNYYIGSLIVFKRKDGKFEVIDGQQRLTTLTVLAGFLKNKGFFEKMPKAQNINFEYREESEHALNQLFNNHPSSLKQIPNNFKEAIDSIQKHFDLTKGEGLVDFLLDKVEIIRTEVPPETDLNHYFEIMNTRGEQLEKHEVLKSRLMSKLSDDVERIAFAKIWDACSDMNRYVALGFKPEIRKNIFGENWQSIPKNFNSISQYFTTPADTSINKKENQSNESEVESTINNIIAGKFVGKEEKQTETSERFNSVIDFSNLLMHILKIYLEKHPVENKNAKDIPLDERNLLESFAFLDKDEREVEIKNFAMLLLQSRYMFDRFVIKTDTSKEKDDHWSLLTLEPADKSSYQYSNTFKEIEKNQNVSMLISMFHVSNPSRMYKNWLYAVLRWLVNQTEVGADNYISYLENLSDRFYFGYYVINVDYFDLIQLESFKNPNYQSLDKMPEAMEYLLSQGGTSIPNFIFNRLDYLLWKIEKYRKIYPEFRFTFRSSVEHFYPQNPPESNQDENIKQVLHSFGNLGLISSSTNSKFTNNMPEAKKANFGKSQYNSLKLAIMMEKAENWNKETIESHGNEMIDILNLQSDLQESKLMHE